MITQIVQSEIKFDAHQDIISVVVYHHSTKYIIKSDYLVLYNKINPSVIIPMRNPMVMLSELVEKYINDYSNRYRYY